MDGFRHGAELRMSYDWAVLMPIRVHGGGSGGYDLIHNRCASGFFGVG